MPRRIDPSTTIEGGSKVRRREAILAALRASPALRILDLATTHGVSTETIRRDLDELSSAGLINRTYGGATGASLIAEPLLDERYRTNPEQRITLARGVVSLVNDGDSLMIDAGATMIYVARTLAAERNDLTVVTTSFGVASALSTNGSISIRICPGEYDPSDGGVSGADTVAYIEQFRVARALLGASRLDAEGPSDYNPLSVSIKRAMISRAERAILVLDHQKLGLSAFQRICGLDAIGDLVTDGRPPETLGTALAAANVSVHVIDG